MHAVCFLWEDRDKHEGIFLIAIQLLQPQFVKNIHETCCCNMKHTAGTDAPQPPLLTDVSLAVCRWAFRATALCCVAQVLWLYPSVSYSLAGRAMLNIVLLWWIYCSNPHTVFTKGCQASSDHDPFRSNTHPLAHRRAWVSHNIWSYKSRFVRRNLALM